MTKIAVIFGGTGFIGRHMAVHILDNNFVDKVVAADIVGLDELVCTNRMKELFASEKWVHVKCDVRQSIELNIPEEITCIYNFAAIHREPGHAPHEYYETNLPGAENVCAWAEAVNCEVIIFSSSISPYGPTEIPKDESSITTPSTAYGCSKLVAEKIHCVWQSRKVDNRRLIILRPGVVFGPGEGGNVSRLIKAVLHGYFVYTGNQQTRKSGIYVKELCDATTWMQGHKESVVLFNMSMNPGPTIEDYVSAILRVSGNSRWIPTIPYELVYLGACVLDPVLRLLNISNSLSPVRVKKLIASNNILPKRLESLGYKYNYDLDAAFKEWQIEMPSDWL